MKIKEMPEKIYLFDYNDAMVTPLEGDTTYVREDVFIEKAAEWLRNEIYTFDPRDTEKMIENFKKAMML
jgi:hypothetical protein